MGIFDKAKQLIDQKVDEAKQRATDEVRDRAPTPLQGQVDRAVDRIDDQVRGHG